MKTQLSTMQMTIITKMCAVATMMIILVALNWMTLASQNGTTYAVMTITIFAMEDAIQKNGTVVIMVRSTAKVRIINV